MEVDKREGGVKQEWGFGRYSIVLLPPHQLLKGHQQYSNTWPDNEVSLGQVLVVMEPSSSHISYPLSLSFLLFF